MVEQLWSGVIIWLGLAFLASLISWRLGISVALVELVVGITAGNSFHLEITPWVNFLASLGALVLTFLAGAELESAVIKKFWKASLALGVVSFAAPFALAWMLAQFVFGWGLRAAQIAGLAMSTTSVAVVYAVMVETGLNETPLGKLILAACFVTDLGTVIALGLLFTNFGATFWIFVAATAVAMATLPRITPFLLRKLNAHSSEPEVRYLLLVLAGLALLAVRGGSEGVLPAYLVGMVLADAFLGNRELIKRMRATTFALLTPFYFLKAGSLVSLRAVLASLGLVAAFFAAKTGAKFLGLVPVGRVLGFTRRVNLYSTMMMSTGLTFGTIAALYGLNNGVITKEQYSVLVVVVILTAIVPTLVAQSFFAPHAQETENPFGRKRGARHV
jgi:Kef-type K+ transport system membrane component KefB